MRYVHDVIELEPVSSAPSDGGYGGRVVPVGPTSVLATRKRRSTTTALTLLDCAGGETRTVRSFPGELRAGVVDPDLRGAWLLAEFGLARVALPELAVEGVIKKGLPRHATYLHELGGGRLAVSRIMGKTLAVVDGASGAVVRRLRLPPAEQLVESEEGRWLHSAEGGESLLLRDGTLEVVRRLPLPPGRGSLACGKTLFVAAGPRIGVAQQPTELVYTIRPERVVRVAGGWSQRAQATSDPIDGLHHLIGVANGDVLHVETSSGFVALDADDLTEVARTTHHAPRWSSWHEGLGAIVTLEQSREREALHLYRWAA